MEGSLRGGEKGQQCPTEPRTPQTLQSSGKASLTWLTEVGRNIVVPCLCTASRTFCRYQNPLLYDGILAAQILLSHNSNQLQMAYNTPSRR